MSATNEAMKAEVLPVSVDDGKTLMSTYRPAPVTFVRGEGSWLYDTDGRRYLDFLSGLAVTSLGHAHPKVSEAIARQARTLLHVSNLFGNVVGPKVAETIDKLVGGGEKRAGGQVFLANSGAEANECAIKLARRWGGPGQFIVVSAYGSFHGRTLATLHATGQPDKHEPFHPLPSGFRHVAWDDMAALENAVRSPHVAAVLLEPIQGEGGVNPLSLGYLRQARELCSERGILLMVDEVQTGLGRTGRWFAFQREGIMPDVVTIAKALGNGMPIAACWGRSEVAEAFRPGDHGSTFGGQPLASAAARATLEVMQEEDVPRRAEASGSRLRAGLEALEGVASVRGEGLLLGAVLESADARSVVDRALAARLVVDAVTPEVIRFAPSLLVTDPEIEECLSVLAKVMRPSGTDDSVATRRD